jgi:hypothetical protein
VAADVLFGASAALAVAGSWLYAATRKRERVEAGESAREQHQEQTAWEVGASAHGQGAAMLLTKRF